MFNKNVQNTNPSANSAGTVDIYMLNDNTRSLILTPQSQPMDQIP